MIIYNGLTYNIFGLSDSWIVGIFWFGQELIQIAQASVPLKMVSYMRKMTGTKHGAAHWKSGRMNGIRNGLGFYRKFHGVLLVFSP